MNFKAGDIVKFTVNLTISQFNTPDFLNPFMNAELVLESDKVQGIIEGPAHKALQDAYRVRIYLVEGIYLSIVVPEHYLLSLDEPFPQKSF